MRKKLCKGAAAFMLLAGAATAKECYGESYVMFNLLVDFYAKQPIYDYLPAGQKFVKLRLFGESQPGCVTLETQCGKLLGRQ